MEAAGATDISRSLAPLREVVGSLSRAADGHIPSGRERRRLVRRTQSAGTAALPALLRAFAAENEDEASWACYLLRRLPAARVVDRLHAMLRDLQVGDDIKARALGLLADLKSPPPRTVVLKDPEALLDTSVRDLLGNLCSKANLRQAVDLILEQVPKDEVPAFLTEVLGHGGDRGLRLLDALIADARTPEEMLGELKEMRDRQAQLLANPRSSRDLQVLERALSLLASGKPQRARKWLEALVLAYPNDGEARSALGVCLLELNLPESALPHLQRAMDLQPESALHKWNLAAAARAADWMGTCYRTLQLYLRSRDGEPGYGERQREARSFCQAYEGMLKDAYPGVPLERVLQGEELFASAYAALSASRYDEATRRFHEVLRLVPRHYPSWGNLGAAYLAMDRREEATHCLRRALELKPDYAIARENLALIDQR